MNAPTFIRIHFTMLLSAWTGSFCQSSPLDSLKAGEWYEAPNSRLDAVKPNPMPNGSLSAVMDAWSGGAYDEKRDRLIVWGGGHGDYAGNEVYVFDVRQLKWERVSDPSTDVGGVESSGLYPDGNPRSRHTYNYIQYVPTIDRFCSLGGAGFYISGQTGTLRTDCFNFDTRKWERKADGFGANIGKFSGVDAAGHVWMHSAGGNPSLGEWDPVADRWTSHSVYNGGWLDYYFSASVGPGNLLAVGGGKILLWDLTHPTSQPQALISSGDITIVSKNCPGLAYDSVVGKFVAWSGGTDVFVFDLASKTWTKVTPASSNKVIPTSAQNNGTFGRFRYIKSRNLFIAVNRTNENVFFYKLSAGGGVSLKDQNRMEPKHAKSAVKLSGTQIRFYAPKNSKTKAWDTQGKNFPLDPKITGPIK